MLEVKWWWSDMYLKYWVKRKNLSTHRRWKQTIAFHTGPSIVMMVDANLEGGSNSIGTSSVSIPSCNTLSFISTLLRAGCLPGRETVKVWGESLDIRMNRSCSTYATSVWSHLRKSSTFSGLMRSMTSSGGRWDRANNVLPYENVPNPVRYTSSSLSLSSSIFCSFVLFGLPFLRWARSSSSSASCLVSHTSFTIVCKSSNVNALPSGGTAW